MSFTEEEIKKLKELYKREFGEDISDDRIAEMAGQVLDLLVAVYKPKRVDN